MICSKCKAQIDDKSVFCSACGEKINTQNNASANNDMFTSDYLQEDNSYDHTAEFDKKDISDNKVISMLVYLMGVFGILIALLAANNSPYVAFHVRQALKFSVITMLMAIVSVLLCWTILVPIAFVIMVLVLFVIRIICFFQICKGEAKEPAIIRSLGFLK